MGGALVVKITGAKVGEHAGQAERKLSIPLGPAAHPFAVELAERAGETIQIPDAKAYSGAVRAAGKRGFPRKRATITPYCFRHQAASDWKGGKMEPLDLSAALGHASDRTASMYGQAQQKRGTTPPPSKVEASRVVKVKTRRTPGKTPAKPPATPGNGS